MLLSEVEKRAQYVKTVRHNLNYLVSCLSELYGGEEVVQEIMSMRNYADVRMHNILLAKGIFKMPLLTDIQVLAKLKGIPIEPKDLRHYGLIGDSGDYWLQDRYCIPLRDVSGCACALICWYPDSRKYITSGTLGFTNVATFFNMESYPKSISEDGKRVVFVVEGIFDALSINSLGYCALGNQGLDLSPVKKEILSRFDKVIFIPDNDSPGRKSNPYLTKFSRHLWMTGYSNDCVITLEGSCKDMDDTIKKYQPVDLKDLIACDYHMRVMT